MDPRIANLQSTPSGRRRTRPPFREVRGTVDRCSRCSRTEPAKARCEPLHGKTEKGGSKVGTGLGMRETPPERQQHPDGAARARGPRPQHDLRPGRDFGLRPAAGNRGAAVGTAPASRRAGPRPRGAAAVERLRRPTPLPRLPAPLRAQVRSFGTAQRFPKRREARWSRPSPRSRNARTNAGRDAGGSSTVCGSRGSCSASLPCPRGQGVTMATVRMPR